MKGLMLKLKLQYSGHLMQRDDSLEKTLMLGKTEGKRRMRLAEDKMVRYTDSMNINLSQFREIVKDRGAWWATVHGVPRSRT